MPGTERAWLRLHCQGPGGARAGIQAGIKSCGCSNATSIAWLTSRIQRDVLIAASRSKESRPLSAFGRLTNNIVTYPHLST